MEAQPQPQTDLRCYFLSDLHLMAKRSRAELISDQINAAVRNAHTIVLGGDIFDFKWSTKPSTAHSIDWSAKWLERLMEEHPHCDIHYILGNHDAHPGFVGELKRLSSYYKRLNWHPYFLRMADSVFLHGDIVDSPLDHDILSERRRAHGEKASPHRIMHHLYDAVVSSGLHKMAIRVSQRPRVLMQKLTDYLTLHEQGPETGTRHVYFGHIHRAFKDVKHGSLTFHNSGATIKGLSFHILDVPIDPLDMWRQPSSEIPKLPDEKGFGNSLSK